MRIIVKSIVFTYIRTRNCLAYITLFYFINCSINNKCYSICLGSINQKTVIIVCSKTYIRIAA